MVIFIITFLSLSIGYLIGRVQSVKTFMEEESEKLDKIIQDVFLKK